MTVFFYQFLLEMLILLVTIKAATIAGLSDWHKFVATLPYLEVAFGLQRPPYKDNEVSCQTTLVHNPVHTIKTLLRHLTFRDLPTT